MPNSPVSYYSRPLAALLGGLMAGILVGSEAPDHWMWVWPVVLVGISGISYGIIRSSPIWLAPLILFVAAGYISIQPWVTTQLPDHHISHFITASSWNISGILDAPAWIDNQRQKFDLTVETLERDNSIIPVTGKLRVTLEGEPLDLNMGDRIRFTGRISPLRNFQNPGGFDYRQFMAFNGIYGSAFVQSSEIKQAAPHRGGFLQWVYRIRKTISRTLDDIGEADERAVLKALLIGERSDVSDRITENFSKTGVIHLLSISGLHVGIVAMTSFFIFRWTFSWFPFFLWRAWTRKSAAILSMVPVLVYGLISGMSPSTQRSVIMIIIFLMTFLIHKEHESINTLATAAILILMVHPPSLFAISFQLSFASVFAILYFLPRFWQPDDDVSDIRKRIKNYVYSSLWVTLSATLGVQPLVMVYFNQISLISPVANFILIPIVGFGVVPLGLVCAGISLISPIASLWGLQLCAAILKLSLNIADFFAALPFSAIKTITPSLLEVICVYMLLLTLMTLKKKPVLDSQLLRALSIRNKESLSAGVKNMLRVLSVASAIVLGLDALYWGYQRFFRSDFRVTVLDVGQGTASLLEFPKGPVMLIDAGGFSGFSAFDMGKMVVAPLLWRKKIRSVDIIVLSHANSDHVNGMIYIAGHFHVKAFWTNTEPEDSAGYRRFMDVLLEQSLFAADFKTFPRHHEINGVSLDIVNPPPDFLERRQMETWRDINNNSLVVHARFGNVTLLFPGDIKSGAEKEMVARYGDRLQSRVLVAPHHGSKSSSSAVFVETIQPRIVIFTTGLNNRFNFPYPSVIKRYGDMGATLLNTATHGAIQICTDGNALTIQPFNSANKAIDSNDSSGSPSL
ncbi:MAG: DNA internalization-related competence protein ComEC/Rec2 [Pseudomonadota bacterium]